MVTMRTSDGTRNFFVDTKDISLPKYDHVMVIEHVERMISLVESKLQATVKFVTCDSDGAHIKARNQMKIKHPRLIFLPCIAHQVNLVLKGILNQVPDFRELLKETTNLIATFNRLAQLLAALQEKRRALSKRPLALITPVDTRWYSFNNMFRSIQENKIALQVQLTSTFLIYFKPSSFKLSSFPGFGRN